MKLARFAGLARFLWPYRGRIAVAAIALLVAAGCVLGLGRGLQYVVDRGFGSGDPRLLDQALAAMIAVVVLYAAATWTRFYFMMSVGERVVTDLRRAVFDHLLNLEPAFFESARTGELMSRLTNDATLLQQVVGYGLSMFVRNGLMMTGAGVMLFITSWKLALFVLVGAPATLLPILLLGRRVRRLSRQSQDRVADVSAYVDEALHEIRTVQAYAHEAVDRASFARHAEAAYRTGVERISHKAFLIAGVILIAFSAVGIILWIGGHDVMAGRLSQGELAAFVFYAGLVAAGAGTVAEVWGELQRAAGASERLVELLDTVPRIVAPAAALAAPQYSPLGIDFDRVTFAYPSRPNVAALDHFTLKIEPGERVALVGPSGAGKSTAFALLLRFYDAQEGAVRIGGVDLRRMDPRAARGLVAVVPQEPVIFAASALENVRYGRPQATREAVLAACEKACALEFIERLPQGLDSPLGERGIMLSGGQKQRLSIARALLADRPILLLDEATSSLDAAAERLVQQGLEALEQGRTTLAIAHRLATVQNADRIIVLERGAIVAQGTHADLMAQGGLYASLARLQFLGEEMKAIIALCALLASSSASAQTLTVGSKRFTESYVLGEIISQTANGTHKPGLGNTAILLEALKAGAIDLYPEYTGTIAREILKSEDRLDLAALNAKLKPLGLAASIPLGFSNSYALGMRRMDAERLGIRKVSDLAKHPAQRFGLSHEFLGRRDGWPGLQGAYGLPQKPRGLDHGIAYEALAASEIDVMDLYTTDAKIERYAIVALDDDRKFFPPYDAVLLYRTEVPLRFPAAFQALGKLEGRIDASTMVKLNARAEIDKVSFSDVAREYLGSKVQARKGLWAALFAPDFGRLLAEHLGLVFGSLAIAALIGVPLGMLAARVPWLAQPVLVTTGLLQTIPALALLALLIPVTGTIGVWPALIALFLYALLPITRNTHTGITEVRRGLVDAGTALGLSRRRVLAHVEMPLALPVIMAGVKTAAVISVGTATIAAFIGAGGFGERITQGLALNDHTVLLAGALPAALLALLVHAAFELIERALMPR